MDFYPRTPSVVCSTRAVERGYTDWRCRRSVDNPQRPLCSPHRRHNSPPQPTRADTCERLYCRHPTCMDCHRHNLPGSHNKSRFWVQAGNFPGCTRPVDKPGRSQVAVHSLKRCCNTTASTSENRQNFGIDPGCTDSRRRIRQHSCSNWPESESGIGHRCTPWPRTPTGPGNPHSVCSTQRHRRQAGAGISS